MFFVSFENQDACYSFGETQSADNVGGFYFYFSVGSVPYSPPWKIAVREELVNNYEFDELPLAVIGRPDLRRAGRGGGGGPLGSLTQLVDPTLLRDLHSKKAIQPDALGNDTAQSGVEIWIP